jgi:outer membrane protein assembly factor BamB
MRRLAFLWMLVLGVAESAPAQEWTRFRGPNGSGIGQGDIPVQWTERDYRWKVELPGVGHSSPVLWGDWIFVTSGEEKSGTRLVLCLQAADGRRRWLRQFPADVHRKHLDNSFASATPAVDDRHLYLTWGSPQGYLVQALDHDGNEVWRVDLGPFKAGHGFGVSPIVHDDLLIVPNDQDGDSFHVALDRLTGKVRWKVPRQSKSSYATPCVYEAGGQAELIFTSWERGITALDPASGRPRWELDVFSKDHVETPIGSPIVAGDLVLGTSGWLAVKQEVVAVRPARAGQGPDQAIAWRIDRGAPLVCTPLVKDDLVFLWSDEGIVTCADRKTGRLHWQERVPGSYYGSPVCVGRHLYCINRKGDVIVLSAEREFRQLARNPPGEGSHSTGAEKTPHPRLMKKRRTTRTMRKSRNR